MNLTDRLYLQLVPDPAGATELTRFQQLYRSAGVTGAYVDTSKFHMTIVHFGELQKAYDELLGWVPGLTVAAFMTATQELVTNYEKLLPIVALLTPLRFGYYGDNSSIVALRVGISPEITTIHRQAADDLINFLDECGVEYPVAFMKSSRIFQFTPALSPHITLIKAVARPKMIALPADITSITTHNTDLL